MCCINWSLVFIALFNKFNHIYNQYTTVINNHIGLDDKTSHKVLTIGINIVTTHINHTNAPVAIIIFLTASWFSFAHSHIAPITGTIALTKLVNHGKNIHHIVSHN